MNPGQKTDTQGQEERGERTGGGGPEKLVHLAGFSCEFHLFVRFVLTHCNADFFNVARTDPVLRPL